MDRDNQAAPSSSVGSGQKSLTDRQTMSLLGARQHAKRSVADILQAHLTQVPHRSNSMSFPSTDNVSLGSPMDISQTANTERPQEPVVIEETLVEDIVAGAVRREVEALMDNLLERY